MKKFKQLIITCCLFISVASLVFITSNTNAQPPPECPWCYVPIGNSHAITVTACNTYTLGAFVSCHGTGWDSGILSGSSCGTGTNWVYSWAPSTHLSCTNCANPTISPCGSAWSPTHITYTLTISQTGTGACCQNTDTVRVTYNGGTACINCGGGGRYAAPTVEVANDGIKVFPNPSTGKVSVILDELNANTSIEVYNIDGKLVMKKNDLTDKTVELNLSNVAKGAYFIQVLSGDKAILNKKILIE